MRELSREISYSKRGPRLRAATLATWVVLALGLACTESRVAPAVVAPTPTLDAVLDLSDSAPAAGERVIATLRLRGALAAKVASFTGRVTYDTTRLRYAGELARTDGATRITNAGAGLVRVAALRVNGLSDGIVAQYQFDVVDPRALMEMRVGVDEIHSLDRADLSRSVTATPSAGAVRP